MKRPRNEKRTERVRTIFRLMVSGQWTPSVRAALRDKWRAAGDCKTTEWEKCCDAARAAVQAEIELDPPTKALLLAGVQETLSSMVSVMSSAQREASTLKLEEDDGKSKMSEVVMKARLLDCSSRAGQTALGYWQLLLGNTSKADDLPQVPPSELLEMLAERLKRQKGGQSE